MTPFQALYFFVSLATFALAWLAGSHPERRSVVAIMMAFVASVLVQEIGTERLRWAVMLVDLALLVFMVHQALVHDRWWLLVATAAAVLNMMAHVTMFLDPDITLRVNIATRWAFGFTMMIALAMGALERRWAGEPAVFGAWLRSRSHAAA